MVEEFEEEVEDWDAEGRLHVEVLVWGLACCWGNEGRGGWGTYIDPQIEDVETTRIRRRSPSTTLLLLHLHLIPSKPINNSILSRPHQIQLHTPQHTNRQIQYMRESRSDYLFTNIKREDLPRAFGGFAPAFED